MKLRYPLFFCIDFHYGYGATLPKVLYIFWYVEYSSVSTLIFIITWYAIYMHTSSKLRASRTKRKNSFCNFSNFLLANRCDKDIEFRNESRTVDRCDHLG